MTGNPYETRQYLHEYLLFHYGRASDLCPLRLIPRATLRFHQRIVDECLSPVRFTGPTRGLDIGCGVGRLTFELGRIVDQVTGLDNSKAFIRAARQMAKAHPRTIQIKEAGAVMHPVTVRLPKALQRSDVEFHVGDALQLAFLTDQPFHVVAAINLLCRLPQPRKFLRQLHQLVLPRGQVVLGTPFSWLEACTPPREWLTDTAVEAILRPHFRLVRRRELPFVIREHRRKYQLVVSAIAVYERRP